VRNGFNYVVQSRSGRWCC